MVDLDIIEQETRESYEKKSQVLMSDKKKRGEKFTEEDRKNYLEKCVKRDMLQKRKFRLQLAQTGAMDRVIRKILGLKGTYKKEELEKPFVVPKIAFNPDVNDPRVRELLLRQGMDATSALFGPDSEKGMIEFQPTHDESIDVEPVPAESQATETTKPEEQKPDKKPVMDAAEFSKLDAQKQVKYLEELMKRKGYKASKLKRPLDKFNDAERGMFFDHLKDKADVEDLPFDE
jgi:hypothetical protein